MLNKEKVLNKEQILKLRDIMDARRDSLEYDYKWCTIKLKIARDILKEVRQGVRTMPPEQVDRMRKLNQARRLRLRQLRIELKKVTDILARIGKKLLINFREDVYSSVFRSRGIAMVMTVQSTRVSSIRKEG